MSIRLVNRVSILEAEVIELKKVIGILKSRFDINETRITTQPVDYPIETITRKRKRRFTVEDGRITD